MGYVHGEEGGGFSFCLSRSSQGATQICCCCQFERAEFGCQTKRHIEGTDPLLSQCVWIHVHVALFLCDCRNQQNAITCSPILFTHLFRRPTHHYVLSFKNHYRHPTLVSPQQQPISSKKTRCSSIWGSSTLQACAAAPAGVSVSYHVQDGLGCLASPVNSSSKATPLPPPSPAQSTSPRTATAAPQRPLPQLPLSLSSQQLSSLMPWRTCSICVS